MAEMVSESNRYQ